MSEEYPGTFSLEPWKKLWRDERPNYVLAATYMLSLENSMEYAYRMWPHGCCMLTTLLEAPLIRTAFEYDLHIVVGRVGNTRPHAWFEDTDGNILDPTYGMFDGGPALRVLDHRHSTLLGHWGEHILTREEEAVLYAGIKPLSSNNGWTDACDVLTLFGDHPYLFAPR